MNVHRCCSVAATDTGRTALAARQNTRADARPPNLIRRCLGIAEWIIPGVILALLPKCPICLAAYIALVTGVGLSMSTLMYLRTTLVVLCIVSLFYLVIRSIRRTSHLKTNH